MKNSRHIDERKNTKRLIGAAKQLTMIENKC